MEYDRFIKGKILVAIVEAITQKYEKTQKKLEELVYKHYITGLYNRLFLTKNGNKLLKKYNTLFVIDIRHLKKFNEIFGYQKVDAVLKSLARELRNFCSQRGCIVGSLDLARFWLLANTKDKEEAKKLAYEIIKLLTENPAEGGEKSKPELMVSVNVGVAFREENGKSIEELLRYAEIAAEKSKEKGINFFMFFDRKFKEEIETNVRIEQMLRESVSRGTLKEEIYPVFQMKVNPKTETPTGAEVLMRWRRFEGPIFKVIQVGEQTGLIKELTLALAFNTLPVVREVIKEFPNFGFSFNLSPVLFKFWDEFKNKEPEFKKYNIPPQNLEFEITEVSLSDVPNATEYVNRIKEKGFKILIDDFGKGFSAFDRLMEIDFDGVKFDKSLMDKLLDAHLKGNRKVVNFIRGLVEFAKSQDYKITAEGVENPRLVNLLKEWDIDEIQGYYYAKPVEADRFLECLHNWDKVKRCYPKGES